MRKTNDMESGNKIKVQLKAKHSYGHRNNPIQVKQIDFTNGDWFTFKGGKTEYRICGNEIYSITGPERFYTLIND
jgi:hypothetical protein